MKRSEAVNFIANFLKHYEDPGFKDERIDDADAILSNLERFGMLPPTVRGKQIPIGYDGKTGEVAAWDISGRAINVWEPENE